ncbi:MAG TPA: hypothetical protein VMU19_07725 [Bryobacteraceae bacterium]|nr:hypothetical protein [Bryobacteraceae bacterium]
MRTALRVLTVAGACIIPMLAQEGSKPAPVLSIGREFIKEGKGAAHEKTETEFVTAFRKAQYPGYYVAAASLSGPSEVWFIEPLASFAAYEKLEEFADKDPLKSTLGMVDERDGELRETTRYVWAMLRPDLSYGVERFNPAKTRFLAAEIIRAKLGKEDSFEEGVKAYFAGHAKAKVDRCVLGYQVTAGLPAGTYLFFSMMDSMKVLDGSAERMKAITEAMGPEAFGKLMHGTGDVITSIDNILLEVKPGMSYPPPKLVEADPEFWGPKPAGDKKPGE